MRSVPVKGMKAPPGEVWVIHSYSTGNGVELSGFSYSESDAGAFANKVAQEVYSDLTEIHGDDYFDEDRWKQQCTKCKKLAVDCADIAHEEYWLYPIKDMEYDLICDITGYDHEVSVERVWLK